MKTLDPTFVEEVLVGLKAWEAKDTLGDVG
jgi:hypothetical protein